MDFFNYKNGELYCEGVPAERIVRDVGTACYVYSKATLLHHYRQITDAFAPLNPTICYSIKSNGNINLCRILAEAGCGFDVTSGGELFRACRPAAIRKRSSTPASARPTERSKRPCVPASPRSTSNPRRRSKTSTASPARSAPRPSAPSASIPMSIPRPTPRPPPAKRKPSLASTSSAPSASSSNIAA